MFYLFQTWNENNINLVLLNAEKIKPKGQYNAIPKRFSLKVFL